MRFHFVLFLLMNLILFVIDFLTGGGWWFYWVTLVWSVAILFQTMATLRMVPKVKEEVEADGELTWSLEDKKRRWF